MKFGQLIFRKIIQIVATRCHILKLKMHQIRFRLGLRPRPRWGSLQRSPRTSSWIEESLLLRGGEGKKGERRKTGKKEGRRKKGRKRKGGKEGKGRGESGPPRI